MFDAQFLHFLGEAWWNDHEKLVAPFSRGSMKGTKGLKCPARPVEQKRSRIASPFCQPRPGRGALSATSALSGGEAHWRRLFRGKSARCARAARTPPMNCATQYVAASRNEIRPATSAPRVTAGLTWQPEIGPRT